MTRKKKEQLAKTVEMPVVRFTEHLTYYTEIELAVLCYLADTVGEEDFEREVTEIRATNCVTTQELPAIQ